MRLSPEQIMQQISNLRLQCPELAENETDWLLSLESETDAFELLRQFECRRQEAIAFFQGIQRHMLEDLAPRLNRFGDRIEKMRIAEFNMMQTAGIKKAELDIATLSIANGQQRVVITDEAIIPDILFRIKREPNLSRIKELLKNGNEVRGATLSNAEPHLTVRTR